ncbi:hypothetical protein F5883DRAFT_212196 [Diaporthe sp. PMI_573]|nr:hypothetical protein F5883DRAFT_212196 [Diaporthaceae sp. PMI_573]
MSSANDKLFEKDKVSSTVSAVDALSFFQNHGVFYHANAEIGELVDKLDKEGLAWKKETLSRYLPILNEDPRLKKILDHYDTENPSLAFYLASDNPKHFYASSIADDEVEDHRAVLYMWGANTNIEVFVGSKILPSKGVKAANGLWEVPYRFLKETKGLNESKAQLDDGGVMIMHPRSAFGSTEGCTMAYAVEEKGYVDKHLQNK